MRYLATAIVLANLIAAPLHAASDPGLSLHSQSARTTARSIALQGNITLKLGRGNDVRPSDRLALGIAAGPMLSIFDNRAGGVKRNVASVAGVIVRPGYSATFNFAGQPFLKSYTRLGAAEADRDGSSSDQPKRRSSGKKVATGAAIAGGVALLALVVYFAIPRHGDRT